MLKVLVITQDEPFFIPGMIEYIRRFGGNEYAISAITVLKPHRKNKSYFHWFRERSRIYSFMELFLSASLFIYCKLFNAISGSSRYSVKNLILKNNLKGIITNDINSEEYVNTIRDLGIDVIISISCPQIFKSKILSSASVCINAHGTLLPRHRGVFGSWWTLFEGDKYGGSTIHTMEEKLDAGVILWQKKFPLNNDTQYSIAYKTKRDMAFGLVEVLKQINSGKMSPVEPQFESSYHRAPSKEQGKQFHKMGLKVIRVSDLKLIIGKKFE